MLNENAKKWVAALRSGDYQQGRGVLHREDRFCCLGVACQLAIKDGVKVTFGQLPGEANVRYDGRTAYLPEAIQSWLGLDTDDGTYVGSALVRLNDTDKLTFEQIADVIESEPEGLFREE